MVDQRSDGHREMVGKQETARREQNRLMTLVHSFNHDIRQKTGKHGKGNLPHNAEVEYSSGSPSIITRNSRVRRLNDNEQNWWMTTGELEYNEKENENAAA